MEYLCLSDADAIHAYVFAPRELRLIRGGSALQRKASERVAQKASHSGRLIFAGGGSVLAALPDKDSANEFCRNAQAFYREATEIATTSITWVEYPGDFGRAYNQLRFRLEQVKQNRAVIHFNGSNPYWVSCQSCGLHPVAAESRPPEPKLICHPCQQRDGEASAIRKDPSEPADFEEIARDANPQNYLAIVYLDFDRLGRYLDRQLEGVEDRFREERFRVLSSRIDRAMQWAVQEAGKPGSRNLPLLIGGDDAVIAMAAENTISFLAGFRRRLDDFWRNEGEHDKLRSSALEKPAERPPISAGIVMAHSHFPISEFMRIAEDLLRSAKGLKDLDAVDYEIVTNSMVGKVVSERAKLAKRRTAKPYRWDEFETMASGLAQLKAQNIPASKLKALYRISYHSDFQADLEYVHLLSRLEPKHRDLLRRAIGPTLWSRRDDNGVVTTNAVDLADLWEFV